MTLATIFFQWYIYNTMASLKILITQKSKDYELIDSGEGEKLERFGKIVVARPDPQALWSKLRPSEWKKADAVFCRDAKSRVSAQGGWRINGKVPDNWFIELAGLKFKIHLSTFKHVGLFPEQESNWVWVQKLVETSPLPPLLRGEGENKNRLSAIFILFPDRPKSRL